MPKFFLSLTCVLVLSASLGSGTTSAESTCSGTYPGYWQDPSFKEMWQGQTLSNVPPDGRGGYQLSDRL